MAEVKIDIKSNGDEIVNTIGNIKKQIKDLRSQALAVGEGGAGFKKLTQEANELQDKLDDLKDSSKSLQGSGIEKLKASFGLLTDSFKNADFGKAKTAFSGLGSAMKAIPIFLIVEGIMYLVENFDKLSKGSGILGKALRFVGDIIAKVTEGITWLLDKLGLVNAELDKQSEAITKNGEKSKAAIDKQSTAYDQLIAIQKAQGKSTVDTEIKKQEYIIATNKALVEQMISYARSGGKLSDEQNKLLTESLNNIKGAVVAEKVVTETAIKDKADKAKVAHEKANEAAKKANEARAKDELDTWNKTIEIRLSNTAAQEANELQAMKDAAAEKIKANQDMLDSMAESNKEMSKEDIAFATATANAVAETYKKSEVGIAEARVTSYAKFEKQMQDVNKFTQAIGSGLNAVVGVFQAIANLNKQEADQDTKERQAKLDTDISSLEDSKDRELAKTGLTEKQKIDIANKYAKIEYSMKLDEYNRSTEVKKKAFEQDKKLKIATAVISTITGAVSAFTGAMQLGPIAGPILGALLAAAVVATGAIQIAAIDATKFDAGTPPAAPKIVVPSSADVPGSGSQQGPQSGPNLFAAGQGDKNGGSNNGQGSNQPMKAYVVSSEISSSQNMNAVLERRSSF